MNVPSAHRREASPSSGPIFEPFSSTIREGGSHRQDADGSRRAKKTKTKKTHMAFVSTRRQFPFKGLPLDAQNRALVARERVRRRFREQIPQTRGRIPRARSVEVPSRGEGCAEDTRRVTWVSRDVKQDDGSEDDARTECGLSKFSYLIKTRSIAWPV